MIRSVYPRKGSWSCRCRLDSKKGRVTKIFLVIGWDANSSWVTTSDTAPWVTRIVASRENYSPEWEFNVQVQHLIPCGVALERWILSNEIYHRNYSKTPGRLSALCFRSRQSAISGLISVSWQPRFWLTETFWVVTNHLINYPEWLNRLSCRIVKGYLTFKAQEDRSHISTEAFFLDKWIHG